MKLLTLQQAALQTPALIGGKSAGLSKLAELGLPVPSTLVLPSTAHRRWLEGGLRQGEVEALWAEAASLGIPLAIRSSAADEDTAERSAAGQYESVMGVASADDLVGAIERCYRAVESSRASAYRGDAAAADVALVLQPAVAAERSGVAFSADPLTGARDAVLIEAVFGHGEGVVSGAVTPDRYAVDRAGRAVTARVADKASIADGRGGLASLPLERRTARTLRDDEARRIAEMVIRAEAGFGRPVDVEFCLCGEKVWFLQARPITTLNGAG